jgi:hypothetical protein
MADGKQKKNSNINTAAASINNYIHQRGKKILRRHSPSTVINDLVGSSPETSPPSSPSSSSSTTGTTTNSTVLKKTKKKEEEKLSSSWSSSHSSSSSIGTTLTSTSTNNTTVTVRAVRFNSKCYVKRTISVYDYTIEEIENCWYQKHELDAIYSICAEDIHKINRRNRNNSNINHQQDDHNDDNDDDLCVRGLDRCIVPSVFIKRDNRQKAKNAVFMEQYNNTMWGSGDSYSTSTSTGISSTSTLSLCSPEENIAQNYQKISYKCQLLAIDIALQDQRNAVYDI